MWGNVRQSPPKSPIIAQCHLCLDIFERIKQSIMNGVFHQKPHTLPLYQDSIVYLYNPIYSNILHIRFVGMYIFIIPYKDSYCRKANNKSVFMKSRFFYASAILGVGFLWVG